MPTQLQHAVIHLATAAPTRGTDAGLIAEFLQSGDQAAFAELKGWVVIKCDAVIPADKTKAFDNEKPMLLVEVVQAKIEREMPKLFKEMKQQANPKYHLTFPDKQ